jgi:hypothetical protein
MNVEEVLADLQAHCAWVDERITEQSDSMEFEEAVAIQDELRRAKRAAEVAIQMIDAQMMVRLEAGGPRQFGGRVFARVKDYVERFDHDVLIAEAVHQACNASVDMDTGALDPYVAAEAAARTMQALYLSDSSKAKMGTIDKLGIDRRTVRSRIFKQWKVSVTEVEREDEE